jgi:hypothetical protein
MIGGRTEIIAHLGYPTESFTAVMIDDRPIFGRGLEWQCCTSQTLSAG